MALPTASDNPFPSLLVTEGTAPSSPASGKQRVYIDSSDHLLKVKNSSGTVTTVGSGVGGSVATDAIWDAAGDLAVGTGADTAAKLTLGASGKAPFSNGSTLAYAFPPGYEFDYVEKTSDTTVTATSGATADTVVTANAKSYDGSTVIYVEVFSDSVVADSSVNAIINIVLYDGSTELGILARQRTPAASLNASQVFASRRLTPSNASHTYSARAYVSTGTGTVSGGSGAAGNHMPCFIRQVKA